MQRYRADKQEVCQVSGATAWYAVWMGGRTLAKVSRCPTPWGPYTVYATSDPDTFFSIPAVMRRQGRRIRGWLGCDDKGWTFHPYVE
jgi:hypothetical protein